MSRGARAGKVTVYGRMDSGSSKPTRLLELAVEYCTSTYGATVAGPPAPSDVEIVVVTVALVEKHSARRQSLSASVWLRYRNGELLNIAASSKSGCYGRNTDRLHR